MATGQMGTGSWAHCRQCEGCGRHHGPLYICPTYPPELQAEIQAASDRYRANLADPEWCKRQIENGLPPEGIVIFRALAGVDD